MNKVVEEAREYKSSLGSLPIEQFIEKMSAFHLTRFVQLYQSLS